MLEAVAYFIDLYRGDIDALLSVTKKYFSYLEDFKKLNFPKDFLKSAPRNTEILELKKAYLRLMEESRKAIEYEQFITWLEAEKKLTEPYRGKALSRMPIFTRLIGYLGNILRPYYLKPFRDDVILPKECGETITKLINGFFFDLNLIFDYHQVHRRYNDYRSN